ncbi:MAG: NAD(+) synthase [Nanoarchaeota archaeon]|nr:NAD(+) synthase [Nanoarchaeota archaeon]
MKIALAQMDVVANRPRKNLETMLAFIDQAKANGVDLIAFPELSLGGYLVGDRWLDESFTSELMSFNEELKKASEGIAIAYGNIFVDTHSTQVQQDGRSRKFNAVYVYQNGKPAKRLQRVTVLPEGIQPKTLLPNYRFFDDKRYFFSLHDLSIDAGLSLEEIIQPFELEFSGKKVRIGFEVCEDLWYKDYRKDGKALNVTKYLIDNGAEYIINISASPWSYGKNEARDKRVAELKEDLGESFVPFFYVNNVGVQNNGKNYITFDGASTVYNKEGRAILFDKKAYEEELLSITEKELDQTGKNRETRPKIQEKYDAIIRGIRHVKDILDTSDQPKYVIGLSGGIDSAVVAALLTKAVGPHKVLGINMSTRYNSSQTKDAAAQVAKKLGIAYETINIQELVDLNTRLLNTLDADGTGKKLSTLNEENVQAKIRGTSILSNIAAKYGALFTNNGNKVEIALGYATLYGDVGGAYSPIGDLTKEEVFALARYLNKEVFKQEVIPTTLLPDQLFRFRDDQIQPSAELKEEQVDPIKIGYHCKLLDAMTDYKKISSEQFLISYLQGSMFTDYGISYDLMKRWGVTRPATFVEDLEWFEQTIQRNVFKRVQSPPIILTSKSAYGYDIRESLLAYEQTRTYQALKEQVLAMDAYKETSEVNP